MASNIQVCDIDPQIPTLYEKFRLRKEKTVAAIILKVDHEKMRVIVEEEYEETNIEELQNELPEHTPRYVIISYVYNHDDGRVSYPLCFVFISPAGCKPEIQMMYAGTKLELVKTLGVSKIFELRSVEEFTEEWLIEKLKFFR